MIRQKVTDNENNNSLFAERCRKSLEKTYGVGFEVPKCVQKTKKSKKLFW